MRQIFYLLVALATLLASCNSFEPDANLHLYSFSKDGKFGFMDAKGEEKIPLHYDFIKEFEQGYAAFKQKGKWGIIRQDGKVTLKPTYEDISHVSEGLASFSKETNGKVGFIDMEGKVIIPPTFDFVKKFSEGLACVKNDDMWQYIDKDGKQAFKGFFPYAEAFKEGVALVQTVDEKMSFIGTDGKKLFEQKFGDAFGFSDGLALVSDVQGFSNYYFVDKKGNKVIKDLPYKIASSFYDGIAGVAKAVGKDTLLLGLIDKKGKEILAPSIVTTDHINYIKFSEGLSGFMRDGKWGYIDSKGNIAITPMFFRVGNFKNGLALIQKEQNYYYINKEGVQIGPSWEYKNDSELINLER